MTLKLKHRVACRGKRTNHILRAHLIEGVWGQSCLSSLPHEDRRVSNHCLLALRDTNWPQLYQHSTETQTDPPTNPIDSSVGVGAMGWLDTQSNAGLRIFGSRGHSHVILISSWPRTTSGHVNIRVSHSVL